MSSVISPSGPTAMFDSRIPDRVARVRSMPLAASGKIDKMRLRADYAAGAITWAKVA